MSATPDTIFLPPFPTPAKAAKGSPCNGCGWGCHVQVCRIGQHFFLDTPAPCPAIIYDDGKVRCGFVLGEVELMMKKGGTEPIVQRMLGVGEGCCADDPAEAP